MTDQNESMGRIEVSQAAIASIAHEAILSCYGIVGTASKGLATGIANALSAESRKGVVVQVLENSIVIDIYVIIEYGTRIASVARSAMNVVKYRVEKALGVSVAEVNVHVVGLRVSNTD